MFVLSTLSGMRKKPKKTEDAKSFNKDQKIENRQKTKKKQKKP